jgi:uncharacterized protein (DUF2147 family)
VSVADCGDGTPCGTVVWIDPESSASGQTPEMIKTKSRNPVLGLKMLYGFKWKSSAWRGGNIYDPEADKTYS